MIIWSIPLAIDNWSKGGSIIASIAKMLLGYFSIYYIVPLVFQCYIITPLIKKHLNKLTVFFSFLITIISIHLTYSFGHLSSKTIPLLLYTGPIYFWLIYYVWGIYNKQQSVINKKSFYISLLISFTGLLFSYVESLYILNISGGHHGLGIKVSSTIMSLGIISIFMNIEKLYLSTIFTRFIEIIGRKSFGLYLIHNYCINVILYLYPNYSNQSWGLKFAFVIISSTMTIYLLSSFLPKQMHKYLGV